MIKITYLEHSGFAVECDDYVLILIIIKEICHSLIKIKKSVYLQVMCTTIILKENIYVGRRI